MNAKYGRVGITAAALLAMLGSISMAAAPTSRPTGRGRAVQAGADDYVISKMRVQQLKGSTYLYKEIETTFAKMGPVVHQIMEDLMSTMKAKHVEIAGPPTFVYKGVTMDRSKPFHLQIGFSVAPGTEAVGDYKVRPLESMLAATVLYSGKIDAVGMGAAYQQLFGDLFGAGLTPSGETREMYLMFEDLESSNNVVLIQAGLK
jgi:hypothetical protein